MADLKDGCYYNDRIYVVVINGKSAFCAVKLIQDKQWGGWVNVKAVHDAVQDWRQCRLWFTPLTLEDVSEDE